MRVIELLLSEIRAPSWNPNQMDDAMALRLEGSIRAFGIVLPLVVRSSGGNGYETIGGAQRLAVLREMGIEPVPCVVVDADDALHAPQRGGIGGVLQIRPGAVGHPHVDGQGRHAEQDRQYNNKKYRDHRAPPISLANLSNVHSHPPVASVSFPLYHGEANMLPRAARQSAAGVRTQRFASQPYDWFAFVE